MKPLKYLFPLFFVLFSFLPSCAQTMPALNSYSPILESENIDRFMDSVVIVQTDSGGLCSGVFVTETEVLTAAHCVSREESITIGGLTLTISSEESPVGSSIGVITHSWWAGDRDLSDSVADDYVVSKYSEEQDLALLECVPGVSCTSGDHSVIPISLTPDVAIGSPAYVLGHPAGLYYYFSNGLFSREAEITDGVEYIYATTDIWFGNSGGPIVDRRGNLVGIASAMGGGMFPSAHLGRFVYISEIRRFLGLAPALAPASEDETTVEVITDYSGEILE